MAWRARKSLVKDLDPSSWAAPWVGPKIASPASRKRSTTPSTSGASGPTMVRPTLSRRAKSTSPSRSDTAISTLVSPVSRAVPALPGATKTEETLDDWATFQARACSRPPPPMIRTFIRSTTFRVPNEAALWQKKPALALLASVHQSRAWEGQEERSSSSLVDPPWLVPPWLVPPWLMVFCQKRMFSSASSRISSIGECRMACCH